MEKLSFEDFKKLELKIGKIITVDPVENSNKLLKLIVDFGVEKRQILAGIAEFYKPANLKNKKFIFITNLETRKMLGLESQGMILCADVDGRAVCLSPIEDVPSGTIIH